MSMRNPLRTWRKIRANELKSVERNTKIRRTHDIINAVCRHTNTKNTVTWEEHIQVPFLVLEYVYDALIEWTTYGSLGDAWPMESGPYEWVRELLTTRWTVRTTFAVHRKLNTPVYRDAAISAALHANKHSRRGAFSFKQWRIRDLPDMWWHDSGYGIDDFDLTDF